MGKGSCGLCRLCICALLSSRKVSSSSCLFLRCTAGQPSWHSYLVREFPDQERFMPSFACYHLVSTRAHVDVEIPHHGQAVCGTHTRRRTSDLKCSLLWAMGLKSFSVGSALRRRHRQETCRCPDLPLPSRTQQYVRLLMLSVASAGNRQVGVRT